MLLVPAYLVYVRAARPFITFYNRCSNAILRALRVRPRDELDSHGLHRRAQRDDRRVGVRGSAGSRGAHPADPGAADSQPGGRRRGGAARRDPGGAGGRGRAPGRRSSAVEKALAATGYSRFPVVDVDHRFIGYLHIKDVLTLGDDPRPWSTWPGSPAAASSRIAAGARGAVADAPQQQPPGAGHRPRRRRGGDGGAGGSGAGFGRRGARRDAACLKQRRPAGCRSSGRPAPNDYAVRVEAFVAPAPRAGTGR